MTTPSAERMLWRQLTQAERHAAIDRIVDSIFSDQIVLLPSETRYALVARADSPVALEQLLTLKGRPQQQPISVFVQSREMISLIAQETVVSRLLADRFLPGPLTIILQAKQKFPSPIVIDGSIGIRLSSDPILQEVTRLTKVPLTATSANRSGEIECTTVDEILAQLGEPEMYAIDDGARIGQTSTVIDARSDSPLILREGAILRSLIEQMTGEN